MLFHGNPAGLVTRFALKINHVQFSSDPVRTRCEPKAPINDGLIRLKHSVLKSKAGEGKKIEKNASNRL